MDKNQSAEEERHRIINGKKFKLMV